MRFCNNNAYHIKIGNVQIGNGQIGNVKMGNAEIGRMEWPFSATKYKSPHGYMICTKMVHLINKQGNNGTVSGINFLASRCNVLNDITRNHVAEHICEH